TNTTIIVVSSINNIVTFNPENLYTDDHNNLVEAVKVENNNTEAMENCMVIIENDVKTERSISKIPSSDNNMVYNNIGITSVSAGALGIPSHFEDTAITNENTGKYLLLG
ncbi:hypothetical protein K8R66_03385, partial [bacterium]|nr:hypothetical protein [bacterium]